MRNITLSFAYLLVLMLFPCPAFSQLPTEEQAKQYNQAIRKAGAMVKKRAYSQALSAFKEAISVYPFGADAYFSAGNIAFHLNKCREALLYMQGFLALGGDKTEDAKDAEHAIKACSSKVKAGSLNVSSQPAGIAVFIDGGFVGKTPVTVNLQAGSYQLLLRDENYEDATEKVHINPEAQSTVEMTLTKKIFYGYLKVKTEPDEGVKVFVDDKEVGVTPLKEPIRLEAKKVLVRFEREGYDTFVRAVVIQKDQTVTMEISLEKSEQ